MEEVGLGIIGCIALGVLIFIIIINININLFIFSKDQKLIRLSNGTLKQINYISDTEIIIDSIKYYSLQTRN